LIENDELLSDETSMVLLPEVVGIPWGHSLQIHNIASLIGTSDALDLNTACDFDFLTGSIDDLVDLKVHFFGDLLHHGVELFVGLDGFLLVNGTILSEGS
jgi:hypothetical protein